MLLLYSTLVKAFFRARYGEPPDLSSGREGQGLVLIADGVGGLDLCGTGLRYVMGALRIPYLVRVVSWGHGLGHWHAELTNAANRAIRARDTAGAVATSPAAPPGAPVFLVG